MGDVLSHDAVDHQRQRPLRLLVDVAVLFFFPQGLYRLEDPGVLLAGGVVFSPREIGDLVHHRRAAGQLADHGVPQIAHGLRIHVLEGAGVLFHSVDVSPRLVSEGVRPHEGFGLVEGEVGDLVYVFHRGGQRPQSVAHAVETELQLKERDQRVEVGVAAPLSDAGDGTLDLPRPRQHRGDGSGDRHPHVVVAVDADIGEGAGHPLHGHADHVWEHPAVGVAEDHPRRARLKSGVHHGQNVVRSVAVAVEKVFRVEQDFLSRRSEESYRVPDHPEILLRRGPQHLAYLVQRAFSVENGAGHRRRRRSCQKVAFFSRHAGVGGGREDAELRALRSHVAQRVKKLPPGVVRDHARLDI